MRSRINHIINIYCSVTPLRSWTKHHGIKNEHLYSLILYIKHHHFVYFDFLLIAKYFRPHI